MLLTVSNLSASIENKLILRGVSLKVGSGEVHAVMGPNGGGKSTLAYALMGHPSYKVTGNNQINKKSSIKLGNKELIDLPTEDRAKAGLFLALQSPIAVPGITVVNLLRTAVSDEKRNVQNPVFMLRPMKKFIDSIKHYAQLLHIDESFLSRGIHDGFSGGEKKKMEMLQALVLQPKFAVFDEIDTGLDVDALKVVARGIQTLSKTGTGVIIITHYQRILKYIHPTHVHILVGGKIVKSGTARLAGEIEEHGYSKYAL